MSPKHIREQLKQVEFLALLCRKRSKGDGCTAQRSWHLQIQASYEPSSRGPRNSKIPQNSTGNVAPSTQWRVMHSSPHPPKSKLPTARTSLQTSICLLLSLCLPPLAVSTPKNYIQQGIPGLADLCTLFCNPQSISVGTKRPSLNIAPGSTILRHKK